MTEPLSQYKVKKTPEVSDWLYIQFNNLDGDPLIRERMEFIRVEFPGYIEITPIHRPSVTVRSAVSEECYTEDFEFQAEEYFKMPVTVKWKD